MKHFTELFLSLDQTTKTTQKTNALVRFFEQASAQDKVWAIALFSHRRPRRTVTTTLLREWAAEKAGIPSWLFEETYHVVGDLAETIAKVIPEGRQEVGRHLPQDTQAGTETKESVPLVGGTRQEVGRPLPQDKGCLLYTSPSPRDRG